MEDENQVSNMETSFIFYGQEYTKLEHLMSESKHEDSLDWFFLVNGKQVGPFNTVAAKSLVSNNTINGSTMVWNRTMPSWLPLEQTQLGLNTVSSHSFAPLPESQKQSGCVFGGDSIQPIPQWPVSSPQGNVTPPLSDGITWYYLFNGQQVGPISTETATNLINTNTINRSTMVWNTTMVGWLPLYQSELNKVAIRQQNQMGSGMVGNYDRSVTTTVLKDSDLIILKVVINNHFSHHK
jgi:hypothetical protein